jgi:hypothetical protein
METLIQKIPEGLCEEFQIPSTQNSVKIELTKEDKLIKVKIILTVLKLILNH